MIIEIEYYKGDVFLLGKDVHFHEFKKQINRIEADYDRQEDNFVSLLCRRYGWIIVTGYIEPIYVYDRDIRHVYKVHRTSGL